MSAPEESLPEAEFKTNLQIVFEEVDAMATRPDELGAFLQKIMEEIENGNNDGRN